MKLTYESSESFKYYKEFYKALILFIKSIKKAWKAHSIIREVKKHLPKNWHITFYYSDCTTSNINFWHNKYEKKDVKPSLVFKKLCDNLSSEFDIKFNKSYGEWNNELESIQASGMYKGLGINIYQYQVDECTFFVEEVKQKKVILTGDCVNF